MSQNSSNGSNPNGPSPTNEGVKFKRGSDGLTVGTSDTLSRDGKRQKNGEVETGVPETKDHQSQTINIKLVKEILALVSVSGNANTQDLRILVTGDTSSGKTSLISGTLEIYNVLPENADACTMFPTQIKIVRPTLNSHQFKLSRNVISKGILFNTSTPEEFVFNDGESTKKQIDAWASAYGGVPNYENIANLEITDKNALQLVLTDTPGPRISNTKGCLRTLIIGEKANPPVIVLTVSCTTADIASSSSGSEIYEALKGTFGRRLIIVITHLDSMKLEDEDTKAKLSKQIGFLRENFKNTNLSFVAVQTGARGAKSLEDIRFAEAKTIEAFPKDFATENGLELGKERLVHLFMKEYIGKYKKGTLNDMKKSINEEINSKVNAHSQLSSTIVPSIESMTISGNLANMVDFISKIEELAKDHVITNIRDYCSKLKIEEPRSSSWYGVFGVSEEESNASVVLSAKNIASEIIRDLSEKSRDLSTKCYIAYESVISKIADHYGKSHKVFGDQIIDCITSYREFFCNDITTKLRESTTLFVHAVHQTGKQKLSTSRICDDLFPTKGPTQRNLVKMFEQIIPLIVLNICINVMEYSSKRFPCYMISYFSTKTNAIKGAKEEVITAIANEIKVLKERSSQVDNIIAHLAILE